MKTTLYLFWFYILFSDQKHIQTALIWNPLTIFGHVITIPWEAGLLRKRVFWFHWWLLLWMTHNIKPLNLGTCVPIWKGLPVATNGPEIFILPFSLVPFVKWSFFALSDFHIWAYTELRSNSSQEDYVSSGHVFRAVRMLSSPQMGNTGGFLLIGFMIDKTNAASLNPSCIFMGWKKFREQVKKAKSFSSKIVLSFYLSWL